MEQDHWTVLRNDNFDITSFECSKCHEKFGAMTHYCPSCGAKLENIVDDLNFDRICEKIMYEYVVNLKSLKHPVIFVTYKTYSIINRNYKYYKCIDQKEYLCGYELKVVPGDDMKFWIGEEFNL